MNLILKILLIMGLFVVSLVAFIVTAYVFDNLCLAFLIGGGILLVVLGIFGKGGDFHRKVDKYIGTTE